MPDDKAQPDPYAPLLSMFGYGFRADELQWVRDAAEKIVVAAVAAERARCEAIVQEECFYEGADASSKGNGADILARIRLNLDINGNPTAAGDAP